MIPGRSRQNGRTVDLPIGRQACSGSLGPALAAGAGAEGGVRELSDCPVRAHPAPRVGVYWWLTDTTRWSQVFGSGNVLIPALGIVFVPWTTLMYLFFWKPEGIDILGWIVIIIAFVGDLGTYGGGFLGNRQRVESYYRRDY
jgi:hypothetical protein